MKQIWFTMKAAAMLATLFFTGGPAFAYYDPGMQRWLNRDPLVERGFRILNQSDATKAFDANHFMFVGNNPILSVDANGLSYVGIGVGLSGAGALCDLVIMYTIHTVAQGMKKGTCFSWQPDCLQVIAFFSGTGPVTVQMCKDCDGNLRVQVNFGQPPLFIGT